MKGYWIEIEQELGATNDAGDDYYLSDISAWWSRNGEDWEEQNGRVELFSTGSDKANKYPDFAEAADSIEEYDKDAADYIREGVPDADPQYSVIVWGVDDAGIQRNVDASSFKNLPEDMIGMINLCEQKTDDEMGLKNAIANQEG